MSDTKLGQILDGSEQRDAIHVAICPVIAGVKIHPGEHIGFLDEKKERVGPCENNIGIVDPFLNVPAVHPDRRCYMLLYPNTITSLRHDWTHPAFAPDAPPPKELSEKWLRDFAESVGLAFSVVMDAAKDFLEFNDRYIQQGSEAARDAMYVDETKREFWKHYKNLTGNAPTNIEENGVPFCCTC